MAQVDAVVERAAIRGFDQLAAFLGTSDRTAKRLVDEDELPSGRILRGSRYWLIDEIRDALRSRPPESRPLGGA